MIREVALDTETTGLDPLTGDRVVEIGAVEMINHVATGRFFHTYLNPERPMNPEAEAVHGLSDRFLADKPVFAQIADAFEAFVADATLVIHNARFDMGFLNAERKRLGRPAWPMSRAVDTVAMARKKRPGAQAGLDALCRHYGIDNTARTRHGALLDAELLAEVYLELMGGRQPGFGLSSGLIVRTNVAAPAPLRRPNAPRPRLTADERAAHDTFVRSLGEHALWRKLDD